MTVTFDLTMNDPGDHNYNAIYADLTQAATDWSRYLNSNATIRVQVEVGYFPENDAGLEVQNDPNDFVAVGRTASGKTIVEPWGEYALLTDSHVPASPYDIHIYFNPDDIGYPMYINPDPAAGGPVPSGEYDATTMFLKGLGYGLGFATMTTTDAAPADWVTELDQYVQYTPNDITGISLGADQIGAYELAGSAVDAVNGGPVALVTPEPGYDEAFEHVGNNPTIAGSNDIFAVSQDIVGESLQISPLDLAMMQEAGVPVIQASTIVPTIVLAPGASYTVTQPDQVISGGSGNTGLIFQSSAGFFFGNDGSDTVVDNGTNDTIVGGTGNMTVSAGSGSPLDFGGSGTLFFSNGSEASTVVGGAGADTIFANAGGGQFWGGSGPMLFVGGSGVSTAVGGSGSSILFGGSNGHDLLVAGQGPSTVVGSGGGNVIVGVGSSQDMLVAGGENETLVGSGGGGGDLMFAGTGNDVLFAGTGNDTFVAATGHSDMIAGSGHDVFLFSDGAAGNSYNIWSFAPGRDQVALAGHGPNAVQNALNSAVVWQGSTTITLSDNSQIYMAGVSQVTARDFVSV